MCAGDCHHKETHCGVYEVQDATSKKYSAGGAAGQFWRRRGRGRASHRGRERERRQGEQLQEAVVALLAAATAGKGDAGCGGVWPRESAQRR
jgi:hypothetical protein